MVAYCLAKLMKDLTLDPFKFMLCLDFEATCWGPISSNLNQTLKKQEVIEFPVVLLNLANGEIVDEFHEYVRPTEKPTLSDYCLNFTGITQEVIDAGILLPDCLSKFTAWLKCAIHRFNLVLPKTDCNDMAGNVAFSTWCLWDSRLIHRECKRKNIPKPSYFGQWMDAREIFKEHYNFGDEKFQFADALKHAGLDVQGRLHSGMDDAKNLARLVYKMKQDGAGLKITLDYFPKVQVNEPL